MSQAGDGSPNADVRGALDQTRKPTVNFAFEWPELWKEFETVDQRANRRKSRSRVYGIVAIAMVLVALMLASWELSRPEADPGVDPDMALLLELAAAGLGLLGTALGLSGVLHRSAKRQWLRDRLITERLRQFHFQWIATHFHDIVTAAGDPEKQEAFRQARNQELPGLMASLQGENLDKTIESIVHGNLELLALPEPPLTPPDQSPKLDGATDAIDAYRAARLTFQFDYAEGKIDKRKSTSFFAPHRQAKFFARLGWTCIGLVVAFHLTHLGAHWIPVPTNWLNLGVIWVALVALALRAMEDGLQPEREVERYEQYRVNCRISLQRYNAATTLPQLIDVMRAFESMSVEESRLFIRVHDQSRFVL